MFEMLRSMGKSTTAIRYMSRNIKKNAPSIVKVMTRNSTNGGMTDLQKKELFYLIALYQQSAGCPSDNQEMCNDVVGRSEE
jgi:hypothetical protein